jgi:hypothetical protein
VVRDLAGRAVRSLDDRAADDQGGRDAGAEVEIDARADVAEFAPRQLRQGRCLDVDRPAAVDAIGRNYLALVTAYSQAHATQEIP